MNKKYLYNCWKAEESIAYIHGWDFSHLNGRFTEETDLPWSYEKIVRSYLKPDYSLLDIDTGGGEFLLSLNHSYDKTSATEGYYPNVELCREKLIPLGISFKKSDDYSDLPFGDESFDIIINRHGNYDIKELYRLLKPNGVFITEQVGEDNDRDLIQLLVPDKLSKSFSGHNLKAQQKRFEDFGFEILESDEAFRPIKFFDTGVLVWFARIIQWEFIGFSVDNCFNNLLKAEEIRRKTGCIEGTIHRFLLIAKK